MADKDFTSLLGKSSGTTFGELAGAYLSSGRKKDNRARNVLLASLFFNAKEASMQSKVVKNLQELEREKVLELDKLTKKYEKQQKILAENELYESSLYKDDLGQEHSTYFRTKANEDFKARYGSIPQANTEAYGEYQRFVNSQEQGYIERHKNKLKGLEDVNLRDVESKEAYLKPYNDYYEAKKKDIARPENVSLVMEPGKSIVARAGFLLTKVTYLKKLEKKIAVTDAGMNDMIRVPLYEGKHPIYNLQQRPKSSESIMIVGPICESADYFQKDYEFEIHESDILAIGDVGAYGFSMSSNYNSRPRVSEVMVNGNDVKLIRLRENNKQNMALEIFDDH